MGVLEQERFDLEWPVLGEVPALDPVAFEISAQENLENRALDMGRRLTQDHEIATLIDKEHVSVIVNDEDEDSSLARIAKITAAGLSVAGLLLAARQLHVHYKKR